MKRLKNLLKLPVLLMIMMFILQSCVEIETNMKVNSDFTGETISKVKVVKGIVTEEMLKKELQETGIQNFKLKKEESKNSETENYVVEVAWKNEEELRKFLTFSGRTGAVEELNEVKNLINSLNGAQKSESAPVQPEAPKEENSKTETKETVKIKDIQQIFKKDKGVVEVNMGTLNIDKLSIKIEGEIVQEENQSGVISSSKDEITFSKGENVSFKYKTKAGMIGKIVGYIILIVMAVIGLIALKRFRDKKKAEESENPDSVNDTGADEIKDSIVEEKVETVEKDAKDDIDNLSDDVLVSAENIFEGENPEDVDGIEVTENENPENENSGNEEAENEKKTEESHGGTENK